MFKECSIILCFLLLLPAAVTAADQPLIIVFPLDGPANTNTLQWLGEGIAVSISDQLDSRALKSMDRSERVKLVESLDLPPGAQLSRGSMIRVAQRAGAEMAAMGSYSGAERDLRVEVRVLNVKTLKLSGEMVANGPLSALPQMENELAWLILSNNGLDKGLSRAKFQERTRKAPNTAYSYYIQSLQASSENDQLQLLLKSVETFRDFPEAQFRLGRLYFKKGDCGSAIPHLLLGRSDPSTQQESDFMRGTCYLQGDQPSQAIDAFSRLLQASRPFQALNNLGVAYLRKGDTLMALNTLLEAKKAARTDATVSLNLALVRHLQGNDQEARSVLEEAGKSHPKNGMLQFLMGMVLKAQGESDKSVAATSKARSLGIKVDKIQTEDPKTWSRVISSLDQ